MKDSIAETKVLVVDDTTSIRATVKEVIEAGVNDYIARPFSPEILQKRIRRLFPA